MNAIPKYIELVICLLLFFLTPNAYLQPQQRKHYISMPKLALLRLQVRWLQCERKHPFPKAKSFQSTFL